MSTLPDPHGPDGCSVGESPPGPDLDEVIHECDELITGHAEPLLAALQCAVTVEHINDAEANVADALEEARALVKALETLSRSFR